MIVGKLAGDGWTNTAAANGHPIYNHSRVVGLVAASPVYLLLTARTSKSSENAPASEPVTEGEAVV